MRKSGYLILFASAGLATWSQTLAAQLPDPRPYEEVQDRADWIAADGQRLAFCLLGARGQRRACALAVYAQSRSGWARIFLDRDRGAHPWAVRLAELDGDSLPEVIVGVFKTSRFDPAPRRRVFVFDWTPEGTLFPKWLGSRLGYPFDDFSVRPGPDGRDRLLTRERPGRGATIVRSYAWNGFGFDCEGREASSASFPSKGHR